MHIDVVKHQPKRVNLHRQASQREFYRLRIFRKVTLLIDGMSLVFASHCRIGWWRPKAVFRTSPPEVSGSEGKTQSCSSPAYVVGHEIEDTAALTK
jgi:hypothetical protein